MKQRRMLIALAGLGIFAAPMFGADLPSPSGEENPGRPGTVNYVEGAAYLNGNQLGNQSIGSSAMNAGDVLTTQAGKAEILLTPGIFLRVGSDSAVKMISPDLAQTQVELDRGRAAVEVDQIFPQNMVQIIDNGVTTQLMKTGYYEFHTNPAEAMVFDGQAEVQVGDGKWEKVKGHHELALQEGAREKTVSFDSHPSNDGLYNWSSLRSKYLAEANNQIAGEYAYDAGLYPGWYWDPWMWNYTFLGPGPFLSPFGWGFYPWGGFYGGGLGFYGRGFYGGHRWYGHGYNGHGFAGHPGYGGHGFASGRFHGGGFHGGGGFSGGGRR